jgi:tripartite-type tricarboxylate transporter receptor subunit TctC
MKTMTKVLFAVVIWATHASAGEAQDYPTRPVTLSVGYAAGGSVDIVARIVAEAMSDKLGQRVIVDNRAGASGMVSAGFVAKARPDGHTIGMVTTTQLATNPHLYSTMPYKLDEFTPVGLVVKAPIGVAIASTVPATTIAEFQEYAKKNAESMTYASFGLGTNSQLVNEMMNEALGFKMTHAPYTQGAMARGDLVSGKVQVLVDSIGTLAPLYNDKQIRLIGNFNDIRSAGAPDVATFKESGFPDLVAYTWFGIVAPAGTPQSVIDILNTTLKEILESDTTKKRLEDTGFLTMYSTATDMSAQIEADYERMGPIIKKLNIRLD